jgi:hypothetical protein
MGSFFKTPTPTYTPLSYVPQTVNPPRSVALQDNETESVNTKPETKNDDQEDSVRSFLKRNMRGRNSLIQTSYRGVLTSTNDLSPQRKNLLGE